MNSTDLRQFDDKGLLLRLEELTGAMTSLQFRHATGQLENTAAIRLNRRAIARVHTIIREREQERGLGAGGLAGTVGKLDAEESAFAAFRKRFSDEG